MAIYDVRRADGAIAAAVVVGVLTVAGLVAAIVSQCGVRLSFADSSSPDHRMKSSKRSGPTCLSDLGIPDRPDNAVISNNRLGRQSSAQAAMVDP